MAEEGVYWERETLRRMLNALVEQAGVGLVCEHLGATEAEVQALGAGIGEWTEERVAALEQVCNVMSLGLGTNYEQLVGGEAEAAAAERERATGAAADAADAEEVFAGYRLEWEEGPIELAEDEVDVTDAGLASNGSTWLEAMERRRQTLWRYRAELLMTQVRLDMTRVEQVTIAGEITRLELALIMNFRDTLPEPGANWDMTRRMWEIERRLTWLRWVQLEREKEYGGMKGVWNWLTGKDRVTGRELYLRMLEEADKTGGEGLGLLELDVDGGFGGNGGRSLGAGRPR